jgi:hypothetical protein
MNPVQEQGGFLGLKPSPQQDNGNNDSRDNHNHHHLFHADKHRCRHNRRLLSSANPALLQSLPLNQTFTPLRTEKQGNTIAGTRRLPPFPGSFGAGLHLPATIFLRRY